MRGLDPLRSEALQMADFSRGEGRLFIGGELRAAKSGRTYPNINPATEALIGEVADAGREDLDAAIAAARRAFDTSAWSRDHALRQRCLVQLREGLMKHKDDLRAQTVAEV